MLQLLDCGIVFKEPYVKLPSYNKNF